MDSKNDKRKLRKKRSSTKLIKGSQQKPRVVIYKSHFYLTAQAIDDSQEHTLIYASTADLDTKNNNQPRKNKTWAQKLGENFATKLQQNGVKEIVFDRNGYLYHGKIAVFCESLRNLGIQF